MDFESGVFLGLRDHLDGNLFLAELVREARQGSARICLRGQLDSGTGAWRRFFARTQARS